MCDRRKARSPEYRRIPSSDYHPWRRARLCKVSPRVDCPRRRNKDRTVPGRGRSPWAPDNGIAPSSRSPGLKTAKNGEKPRGFPSSISWQESRKVSKFCELLFQKIPEKILSLFFFSSFCSPLRLRWQQRVATLIKRDCGARNGSCFARLQPRHHLGGSLLLHIFQFSLPSTLPPFLPKVLSFSLSLFDRIAVSLPSFLPMRMHSDGCMDANRYRL